MPTALTPLPTHRDSDKPLVSLAYWSVVESVLRDHGHDLQWLDQDPGMVQARVSGRLTCAHYERLLVRSIALVGDALGYETGLRGYPSKHGALGMALMSSPTLAQALAIGLRYQHSRMPYYDMALQLTDQWAFVQVHERIPSPPALQGFGMDAALVEVATLIQALAGLPKQDLQLFFDRPEPAYFERYRSRLPFCTFNWPLNQVAIRTSALETKLVSANQEAMRVACLECDLDMTRLGFTGSFSERVRASLQSTESAPRTIEQMAQSLFVSERSLKRYLQQEGCTFKQLQDEARMRAAQSLLILGSLSISDIAVRVGFEDPAHFTRAFKRWTGHTPSAARACVNSRSAR